MSKKQTALAISTTEAEYVSAEKACKQALWMKQALVDYKVKLNGVPVLCDNKEAIDLSKNPVLHSRTKHIEIRHHFLRDNIQKGNISIEKVARSSTINNESITPRPSFATIERMENEPPPIPPMKSSFPLPTPELEPTPPPLPPQCLPPPPPQFSPPMRCFRTGKKITINESDTAGYDKSKVECFNCHKMGHFARECRGFRNQESRPRNQYSSRRTMNVEDTSSKAMVAIDGAGFDWSYMADEEVPTNLALMDFSDSEIEKLKKEQESNQIKINNFENASKSLDKLIGSQISDNNRKGVGYNVIPPPPTGLFAPPTIDLSNSGLKEFQQPEFEGYGFKDNKSV
ncbi:putative ribonuclease H-like domain-containing protein, partial [Tanacetum coccineum]